MADELFEFEDDFTNNDDKNVDNNKKNKVRSRLINDNNNRNDNDEEVYSSDLEASMSKVMENSGEKNNHHHVEIKDFYDLQDTSTKLEILKIQEEINLQRLASNGSNENNSFGTKDTEIYDSNNSISNTNDTINNNNIKLVTPPENFAFVCGEVYRSSFPKEENFEFLKKLKLKSVICLIPEEYPSENLNFLQEYNINFFQIGMSGNKEPFVKIKPELVERALKIVLNPEHQPILVHCNRGKHRTGCLIGCIRKLQKWSLSMIFDEYRKFSYPKERPLDQQFIEMFDDDEINKYAYEKGWLPLKW